VTHTGADPQKSPLPRLVSDEGLRFSPILLGAHGRALRARNLEGNGAAGGHTVVLQIKLGEAFGGTIPASGDLDGNTMDLSAGPHAFAPTRRK
jgi:hypothetical protein